MYKDFFALTSNPFELSPDPSFFYSSPSHQEGLANLCYGIEKRKAIVVLTGEVGTGKTLLARMLVSVLHKNSIPYCFIVNPRFTPTELLQYMLAEFRVEACGSRRSDLLLNVSHFLVEMHGRGLSPVLVVDEAHLMSSNTLEEVRMLTNLETTREKLIQVLLIGQPELERRLDAQELRGLKHRVTLRCQLRRFTSEEVRAYVEHRLGVAGSGDRKSDLFPESTLAAIVKHSGGNPRLINSICEGALIAAYARQLPSVPPEIVDEVAMDLRVNEASPTTEAESGPDEAVLIRRLLRLLQPSQGSAAARRHSHRGSPRI
jgi:general secretion pathway protein A